MPTPEQRTLIEAISGLLESEPRIEAAWLSGSLGKGEGDEFSDVDVLALAGDAPVPEVSADIAKRLGEVATPVLVNPLFGGAVLNVVTGDWARFDISFVSPDFLARYDAAGSNDAVQPHGPRAAQAQAGALSSVARTGAGARQ